MSNIPSKALTAAGHQLGYLMFKDGDARYITGKSRTAPASGVTGSGAFRLFGITEANITIPDTESVVIDGDDKRITEFVFDSPASRKFNAVMAVYDREMQAAFLGATIINRAGGTMFARSSSITPSYSALAVFNGRAQRYPTGAPIWYTDIVTNVTVKVMGRPSMTLREGAVFNLSMTMLPSMYDANGISLTTATNGVTDADVLNFESLYPTTFSRHTGNGAATAFEVDEKPAGVDYVFVTVNGVSVSVSSVNNSTLPYTITLSAAPANNAVIVTQYGFDPSGVS